MPARPGKVDRAALVQAAMSRGGGGGSAQALAAAMQQFMASFSSAMSKMMKQVGQAQEATSQQSQQAMANIANVAEQSYNQAQRKAEIKHKEERQDTATEGAREYQLDLADYQAALNKQVEADGKEIGLLMQQEEAAKNRILEKRERSVATIADARESAWQWINETDGNNGWDLLPGGLKTREQMLDLIRMSGVVNEDFQDSPYSDRLHAMVGQAQAAILSGESEFESVVGTQPAPPLLPVPASMADSLGLDLPMLTREEMDEWENRNGYPKGGVWAMKTDDPKLLMVNPVGFAALMAAKQQDTFLAMTGAKMVQRDYLLKQARKQKEWDEYAKPIEDAAVELTKQFNIMVPDALAAVLNPIKGEKATGVPGVGATMAPMEGSDSRSLLHNIYASMLRRNPDLVDKAMRLGLPEGDPKRWVPGMDSDPAVKAQDFYAVQQIKAATDALANHLETAHTDPTFRSNVAAWLGGLSAPQVWQAGLSEEVASAISGIKRGGTKAEHDFGFVPTRKLMERAVSQVIANLSIANREQISIPARNNTVMHVWRESNHAAAVLQDGTALAVLSRMDPDELKSAGESGSLPEGLTEAAANPGLFRVPVGILKGVAMMNSRTGARSAIHTYIQGGLLEEEEEVYTNEKYNQSTAYYQHVAENGLGPTSVAAKPGFPAPARRAQPYRSLSDLLHKDRAASVMPPSGQPAPGAAEKPAPAPAKAQPAPGQGVPPVTSPEVGGFGEPQRNLGETSQLTPPPVAAQPPPAQPPQLPPGTEGQ